MSEEDRNVFTSIDKKGGGSKQMDDLNQKCPKRKTSKLKGIPKLEDANDAGTKNSQQCTLILTEGDSAKTLAVSGLSVVGRDKYGVFPFRRKLLNVCDLNVNQIADSAEVNAIIKILGLQYTKKYETEDDFKTLRYGKLLIMANHDSDGSQFKGLLLNFFHRFWPALFKRDFVEDFITPIAKATEGKEEVSFYSLPEYSEWRMNTDNWKSYTIKYYNGLGTLTSKEAKKCFSDMVRHRIRFKYNGADDDKAVNMAFSKKKIEARTDYLMKLMQDKNQRKQQGLAEECLYNKETRFVTLKDFFNYEIVCSWNLHSIPCLVDGLKPGQRKVLFACFKRANKREVKVAQLAGAVAEISAYHHGEQSLMGTIVNLAQDYVGSHNINLLLPIGQFGTRLQGGKDSASARSIFAQLSQVTRTLFPAHDDNVLRFLYEENQRIEPEWYCPIIPMVLVNGAQGTGTGWSTNIPNYNPRELVKNIKRLIAGEPQKALAPWYKNFRGKIIQIDPSRFACYGEVAVLDDNTIEITELPIKQWTQDYKEKVLEGLMESSDEKKPPVIVDYQEIHTDTTVKFVVKLVPGKLRELERSQELHQVLQLQSIICTSSMVLFDAAGCLRTYISPEAITQEFYDSRQEKYLQRKKYLLGVLQAQSKRLTNQARFILAKINKEIVFENKKKVAIVDDLIKMGFDADPVKKWKEEQKLKLRESGEIELDEDDLAAVAIEEDEAISSAAKAVETKLSDYDYLVGMALIKLSEEEKNKLIKESEEKMAEVRVLEKKTWQDLWHEDLDNFVSELDRQEACEKADQDASIKNAAKKLAADAKTGHGSKKNVCTEVLPSKDGHRIEPMLEAATKAKYEKKSQPKKERVKKEPKKAQEPRKSKKEWECDSSESEHGVSSDEEIINKPRARAERGAAKAARKAAPGKMAAGSDDDEPTTSKTSPSKYGSDDEEKEFDSGIVVPSGKRPRPADAVDSGSRTQHQEMKKRRVAHSESD